MQMAPSRLSHWISGLVVLVVSVIMIRNAWIVDDAYITFRTVDNVVSGYGLTWNPDERVQSYTHPLWMFVVTLVYLITNELFFSVIILSFVISMAAFIVLWRNGSRQWWSSLWLGSALIASKAILDYTSSGLENPLSYLFVVLFIGLFHAVLNTTTPTMTQLGGLYAIAALSFFNRNDTIVIYIPALLWATYHARALGIGAIVRTIAVATLPASGWLIFSIIYYGYPLPNTAYAKALATDIPLDWQLRRGWDYLWNSWQWDTLSWLIFGGALGYTIWRKAWRELIIMAGAVTYLGLIFWSGAAATHMSGRFFALLLLVGIIIAFRQIQYHKQVSVIGATIFLAYSAWSPISALKYGTEAYVAYNQPVSSIDAKWYVYHEGAALLNWRPGLEMPAHEWYRWGQVARDDAQHVYVGGALGGEAIGYAGFAAGPQDYFIDVVGLSDPLLSRLPAQLPAQYSDWKSGHFHREVPTGYVESLTHNENRIVDPFTYAYYDIVRLITRAPLWSQERWWAIWQMNTGQYDHLRTLHVDRHIKKGRIHLVLEDVDATPHQ
jgi:arabinofuranosyltransferase